MKKAFLYILSLVAFVSCQKDSNENGEPFYFKGVINGQTVEWLVPFISRYSTDHRPFHLSLSRPGGRSRFFCAMNDLLPYQDNLGMSIFADDISGSTSKNSISVDFVRSSKGLDDAYGIMKGWFTNGPKTFGLHRKECTDPVLDGIVIYYGDANGKSWRSVPFASNIFEQISLEAETRTDEYSKKWKVRFSCRLFDENGNYIDMMKCEMYGPVFPI
jgi:hypothetical protein